MKKFLPAVLVATALALGPASAAEAGSFHGVVSQDNLTATDFQRMAYAKVGSVRVRVGWETVEPRVGQRTWRRWDAFVGRASTYGVRVLPVLVGPGPRGVSNPPVDRRSRKLFAKFAGAFAGRYGRGGSFWAGRARDVPITAYQIANEQNGLAYWDGRPNPRAYAKLVKAVAGKVERADRRAEIVLGGMYGMPQGNGALTSWAYLKKLYKVRGIERSFDTVAIHPYAETLAGIKRQIKKARSAMRRARDGRAKLRITEIGFGSGASGGFEKGAQGQADMLTKLYRSLERRRREWKLKAVNWFSWQDNPTAGCSFCSTSGLFSASGVPKPSWFAFVEVSR